MPGELPTWVSAAGALVGTGFTAAVLAWKETRKDRAAEPSASGTSVVAASVISDAGVEKVARVVREAAESLHDDLRRTRESTDDLRDATRDLERAVREGLPPVAGLGQLAALMARLDKVERER